MWNWPQNGPWLPPNQMCRPGPRQQQVSILQALITLTIVNVSGGDDFSETVVTARNLESFDRPVNYDRNKTGFGFREESFMSKSIFKNCEKGASDSYAWLGYLGWDYLVPFLRSLLSCMHYFPPKSYSSFQVLINLYWYCLLFCFLLSCHCASSDLLIFFSMERISDFLHTCMVWLSLFCCVCLALEVRKHNLSNKT